MAVGGQVFVITNGEPVPMWNFNRMVWKELGDDGNKPIIRIPWYLGLPLAMLSEFWAWFTGTKTQFNIFAIKYVTGVQWYNIDKVRTHHDHVK